MKNPAWARDELLLALVLYFDLGPARISTANAALDDLSALLNRFPSPAGEVKESNYRSPSSVAMKLWNFASLDPDFSGKGLPAGGKADREVWKEFAPLEQRQRLKQLSETIKDLLKNDLEIEILISPEQGISEAVEGKLLTREHVFRERNKTLIKRKKESTLAAFGSLKCEVCAFDFEAAYGLHGRGYVECHHIRPLHTLKPGSRTRLGDLALLCSNCHRMIHATRPWLSVESLRAIVDTRSKMGLSR